MLSEAQIITGRPISIRISVQASEMNSKRLCDFTRLVYNLVNERFKSLFWLAKIVCGGGQIVMYILLIDLLCYLKSRVVVLMMLRCRLSGTICIIMCKLSGGTKGNHVKRHKCVYVQ